jgi:predicted site-specific integrase-resolvase
MSTLLKTPAAAERLGLSTKCLENWRITGEGPVFRKFGRAVRYHVEDLDAFVEGAGRRNTAEYDR